MDEELETRRRILTLLMDTPGISTAAAARALELDAATADHHLRKLRRGARVASAAVGREVCWYATRCGFCPVLQRAIPTLRRPGLAAVARELREFAQTSPTLAEHSGVEVGQVRWAATALVGCGLAERSAAGFLRLAPGAHTCVQKALAGERCSEWGGCAPSKTWAAAWDARAAPAGRRSAGPQRSTQREG